MDESLNRRVLILEIKKRGMEESGLYKGSVKSMRVIRVRSQKGWKDTCTELV